MALVSPYTMPLESTLTLSYVPPSATILRKKGIRRAHIQMNYAQYEDKIVGAFKVALVGWPSSGRVSNPGVLPSHEVHALRDALARGACKWVVLTPEEAAARTIDNCGRVADAEQGHGSPQEQAQNGDGGEGNENTA
jgi:hypothetical protein